MVSLISDLNKSSVKLKFKEGLPIIYPFSVLEANFKKENFVDLSLFKYFFLKYYMNKTRAKVNLIYCIKYKCWSQNCVDNLEKTALLSLWLLNVWEI